MIGCGHQSGGELSVTMLGGGDICIGCAADVTKRMLALRHISVSLNGNGAAPAHGRGARPKRVARAAAVAPEAKAVSPFKAAWTPERRAAQGKRARKAAKARKRAKAAAEASPAPA